MMVSSSSEQSIVALDGYKPGATVETFEIDLKGMVKSPEHYRDYDGRLQLFRKIKLASRERFETLLQFVSPEALLTRIPSYIKYTYKKIIYKMFNYTNKQIRVSQGALFIDKNMVVRLYKISCHFLAYQVNHFPKIICFESINDPEKKVNDRTYLKYFKRNSCWHVLSSPTLKNKVERFNEALFTQQPILIKNKKTFISENSGMAALIRNIPPEADLKENPDLLHFASRIETCSLTILNYTNHQIKFDLFCNLRIDGYATSQFTDADCQIVAFHLEGTPSLIFFEQKDLASLIPSPRFFNEFIWLRPGDAFKSDIWIKKIRKIREKRVFNVVWAGIYDKNSFFNKNGILKEIIAIIFAKYLFVNKH